MTENKPQEIQFDRLINGSFNDFNGEIVAASLRKNENLWDAFLFGRFEYGYLIELRDLSKNYLNADTLMILTTKDKLEALLKVIEGWNVDEVGYNYYDEENTEVSDKGYFRFKDTAPFRDEKELWSAFGSSLDKNQVLIRVWWD